MRSKHDTSGLKKMIKNLRKMQGGKISWGFDDTPHPNDRGALTMADVAKLVERGHPNGGLFPNTNTPARPFFEQATEDDENLRELRRTIKRTQHAVLHNKITLQEKMNTIGEVLVRQVQESILNFGGTPAESTLDLREYRGFTGTDVLVESGSLLEGVTFSVENIR